VANLTANYLASRMDISEGLATTILNRVRGVPCRR
jgi:hypothetical protein